MGDSTKDGNDYSEDNTLLYAETRQPKYSQTKFLFMSKLYTWASAILAYSPFPVPRGVAPPENRLHVWAGDGLVAVADGELATCKCWFALSSSPFSLSIKSECTSMRNGFISV